MSVILYIMSRLVTLCTAFCGLSISTLASIPRTKHLANYFARLYKLGLPSLRNEVAAYLSPYMELVY